jgi:hypothetical protein
MKASSAFIFSDFVQIAYPVSRLTQAFSRPEKALESAACESSEMDGTLASTEIVLL